MTRRRQPTELSARKPAAAPTTEELKPIKTLCEEIVQEQNPARFKELVYKLSAILDARAAGHSSSLGRTA